MRSVDFSPRRARRTRRWHIIFHDLLFVSFLVEYEATEFVMHEMGIALQIIEIAAESIPPELKTVRVARVNLRIGKLSAVVPDSLRFCFEVASKDTALEGAELAIEEIPVVARCRDCQTEWTISGPAFVCKTCESGKLEILSGRELDIESIEIADGG